MEVHPYLGINEPIRRTIIEAIKVLVDTKKMLKAKQAMISLQRMADEAIKILVETKKNAQGKTSNDFIAEDGR